MKRFSKFMLSVAAVSAVTAAMAVSAMAADVTATYDTEVDDGTVNITVVDGTGASQTLLVLNNDATAVVEADIEQIGQKDDGASFTEFKLPAGIYADLAEGQSKTYYIRIGGSNGSMQKGTLTISKGGEIPTVKLLIGDVNGDTDVDPDDAVEILRYSVGATELTDEQMLKAGYCDNDPDVDAEDAVCILRYAVGSEGSGNAGIEMEFPVQQ
ncbi:MAG: dockerin type I repeat-containing protein [Oscillospiraceae bacterium]|nr:dockerin type I repeat-containing protein [Oscillospiraceae bacterium]